MNKDRLAARLLATFVGELDEQVRLMNQDLLALEAAPDDAGRLTSLFRVAHTLKGAARAVGVPEIEDACHALETMLLPVRDGRQPLRPDQLALLFSAADALADAGARLRRGEGLEASPIGQLGSDLGGGDGLGDDRELDAPDFLLPPAAAAWGAPVVDRAVIDRVAPSSSAPHASRAPDVAPVSAEPSPPTPGVEAATPPAPQAGAAPAEPNPTGTPDARNAPGGGAEGPLRVQGEKLAALFATAGQLSVTVEQVTARAAVAREVAELAGGWSAEWRRGQRRLRVALERAGASPELLRTLHHLDEGAREVADAARRLADGAVADARALERAAGETTDRVWRMRTRPVADLYESLPRVVRDLAVAGRKEVRLELRGGDVEADRAVLDALREAVLHVVRNAVDHGVEPPEARVRAGKPRQATVRVSADARGDRLVIEVADDGRGVDVAAVRARLAALGRAVPDDDREVARTLFEPGMSTRAEATTISGRGVGLDLVRAAAERVGGEVDLAWAPGGGTTVTVECPVSLATLRGVVARVSGQTVVIPTAYVQRLLRVRPADVRRAEGRTLLPAAEGPVPLVTLARVLGPPLADQTVADEVPVVLLQAGGRRLAVTVDELVAEQEVVVRPLDRTGQRLPHLAGAAILGTGRQGATVALVLNPPEVVTTGLGGGAGAEVALAPAAVERRRPRVLVVDDSITTRTLEQSVLEAAGYDVVTAVDGMDGWRVVQEQGCDLVVTDVEMPRMDGFALCRAIRASKRFATLPVVLVTALERPEHRAQGLDAGADAYIGKSGFDQQNLLDTVRQLLD